jgi:lipid-A-disaccharide synthase
VVVTLNGPGEVAAWLYPVLDALQARAPGVDVCAALLPCVFASGAEPAVLETMDGVTSVTRPRETLRWIWRGAHPGAFDPTRPGCVLHLGGELVLSALLARRLGYPMVAYAEDPVRYAGLVDRLCLSDGTVMPRWGSQQAKARVVGNLMVDAARLRVPSRAHANGGPRTIALFPGSRPYQVRNMLPFLVKVAAGVAASGMPTRWIVAKSDFVADDALAAFAMMDGTGERFMEGDASRLTSRNGASPRLRTDAGFEIDVMAPGDAMRVADLAVTIPGTNTAELAALGIPMLLLLPTYGLHTVPLPGLAGHVGGVPLVGPLVRRLVAESYLRTRRYWSHPNRRAGAAVVPEMIGKLTADEVGTAIGRLLAAPLEPMSARLRAVMGPPGSAVRLVDEVLATIRTTTGLRA